MKNYNVIRTELKKYSSSLDKKKEVIVLTKADLIKTNEMKLKIKKLKDKLKRDICSISINDNESIHNLKKLLLSENNNNNQLVKKTWSP